MVISKTCRLPYHWFSTKYKSILPCHDTTASRECSHDNVKWIHYFMPLPLSHIRPRICTHARTHACTCARAHTHTHTPVHTQIKHLITESYVQMYITVNGYKLCLAGLWSKPPNTGQEGTLFLYYDCKVGCNMSPFILFHIINSI